MSEHHHHDHRQTEPPLTGVHHHVPYWKRAHTDWRFWIGVVLMFAAIVTYVLSLDLAWRPRPNPPTPTSVEATE